MSNIDGKTYACRDIDGNLIAIDHDSGGYPWVPPSLNGIRFWIDREQAQDYASHFKQFDVVEVTVTVKKVSP